MHESLFGIPGCPWNKFLKRITEDWGIGLVGGIPVIFWGL
jgi:hypothetical protein